ncbi:MAG: 3-deoxy-D-manno-octulosonic acid transferase [Acidobacteriota bacterium]|nr:3-deoxy-D-manno-octulosonic acid transferase [Acidobacteriota bacterium]
MLYLPFFLYRVVVQDKSLVNLCKRFIPPAALPTTIPPESTLWIHAVSVGEVKAAEPLVRALTEDSRKLFVSTITDTGQGLARSLFVGQAQVFYFPLDWQWLCRLYLSRIRPSAVLLMETEIWPGFISAAASLEIPILLINGRISDQSFRRYQGIQFFLGPLLQLMSHFCMQTRQDKERILKLGARADRVNQMGNLKYDYQLTEIPEQTAMVKRLENILKPAADDFLWVCGSTREGEERLLLEVFLPLSQKFPTLRMLLAPRHPHRAEEISRLVDHHGFSHLRSSQLDSQKITSPRVLILDSIGELAYLYQLADVVFVGGSLVATGGHNIIEVAYFAKPILFGPHMENFKEISSAFLESYAALQVQSAKELTSKLHDLLSDADTRRWLGRNARKVVRDNQGAVERTLQIVRQYAGRTNARGKARWRA